MTAYVITRQARQDLIDIADYIATRNLEAAIRQRDRLFAAFDMLAQYPGLGHVRDDIVERSSFLRFWRVGRYAVVYRVRGDVLQIVKIISFSRDFSALLAVTNA